MARRVPGWMPAVLIAALIVPLLALPAAAQQTLDLVKKRGKLLCGVSPVAPGFSYLDDRGERHGFDIDVCAAVAAAVFADVRKVEYSALDTNVRFQALQSGEVDLLSAQITWTFTRDNSLGLDFGPIVFHDGQTIMVGAKLGVKNTAELDGAAICLLPGTTSLQNLEDYFRPRRLKYEAVVFENSDEWRNAFFSGRCDAISADRSAIVSVRSMAKDPSQYVVLPDMISQEPIAPVIRQNDSNWRDIVSWTIYAMITAEAKGITRDNVESFLISPDPEIQRLLGTTGDFGTMLRLDRKWAYNVIKAMGNYGEMFDRNVGSSSVLALARGPNKLWINGGLIYSPPFR